MIKVDQWDTGDTKDGMRDRGIFVEVDEVDALRLIQSLIAQILTGDPNVNRHEFYTQNGTYLTVAVFSGKHQADQRYEQRGREVAGARKMLASLLYATTNEDATVDLYKEIIQRAMPEILDDIGA